MFHLRDRSVPSAEGGSPRRTLAGALLVGAAYYGAAVLGLELHFPGGAVPALWPPCAVLLSALLLAPPGRGWVYLLAAAPAHLAALSRLDMHAWQAAWGLLAAALLAGLSAAGIRRLVAGGSRTDTLRPLGAFLGVAVLAVPLAVSLLSAGAAAAVGAGPAVPWHRGFVTVALSHLTLVPPIVLWGACGRRWLRRATPARWAEAGLLAAGLLAVGVLIQGSSRGALPVLLYAPLPLLLWSAVRFGPGGAATSVLLVTLLVFWAATHGSGPLSALPSSGDTLQLQLFLVTVSLPLLVLGTLTAERARALRAAAESERHARRQLAKLSTVYRTAPVGLAFVDRELRFVDVNDRLAEINGLRAEDFGGRTLREVLPWLADEVEPLYRGVLETGAPVTEVEVRAALPSRPGERRDRLVSYHPVRDDGGAVIGVNAVVQDITERKRAVEALRDSEERFRTLVQSLPVGVLVQAPGGEVLVCNQAAAGVLRLTREQRLGREPLEPPRDAVREDGTPMSAGDHPVRRALATRLPVRNVVMGLPAPHGGDRTWILADAIPSLAADGGVGRVLLAFTDITERKRAEQALKESEARNRAVLRALPDTVFLQDAEGAYLDFHARDPGALPFPPEEFLGRNMRDVLPPEIERGLRDRIRQARESGDTAVLEFSLPVRGEARSFEARIVACGPGRVLSVVRDVTERKRTEQALRERDERYQLATSAGRVSVWDLDAETGRVYVDPVLLSLLGYEDGDAGGYDSWAARIHPQDQPRVLAHEAAFMTLSAARDPEGNTPFPPIEYRVLHRDGEYRWFSTRGTIFRKPDGTPSRVVASVIDVTERRQIEEALRTSHEALLRSSGQVRDLAGKLILAQEEERRRISRELHDDLNQKVAAIAISVSNLKRGPAGKEAPAREEFARILAALGALSEEIRHLSHEMHPPVLEHAGLASALRSYCRELREISGIHIEQDIGEVPPGLPPDVSLCLYRVAQEALGNVVRHAYAGRVRLRLADRDTGMELTVTDDGVGFDPGRVRRGLGLVSMEERVRMLGGEFQVRSLPRRDTTLRAWVPLDKAAP